MIYVAVTFMLFFLSKWKLSEIKHNKDDYETHKSYKIEKPHCRDSNLENAALQYSVLPAELQLWSVNL